jgi:hypothetical protein
MIITSVLGSVRREQEEEKQDHTTQIKMQPCSALSFMDTRIFPQNRMLVSLCGRRTAQFRWSADARFIMGPAMANASLLFLSRLGAGKARIRLVDRNLQGHPGSNFFLPTYAKSVEYVFCALRQTTTTQLTKFNCVAKTNLSTAMRDGMCGAKQLPCGNEVLFPGAARTIFRNLCLTKFPPRTPRVGAGPVLLCGGGDVGEKNKGRRSTV